MPAHASARRYGKEQGWRPDAYLSPVIPTVARAACSSDSRQQTHQKKYSAEAQSGTESDARLSRSFRARSDADLDSLPDLSLQTQCTLAAPSKSIAIRSVGSEDEHQIDRLRESGSHTRTDSTTRSSLKDISEGSDNEGEAFDASDRSSRYNSVVQSSKRGTSSRNRNVRFSGQVRNRPSILQQQLGSLPNASLASLFSSLTTSSGSSGNSTVTQHSYDKHAVRRKRTKVRRRKTARMSEDKQLAVTLSRERAGSRDEAKMESLAVETQNSKRNGEIRANMSRPASSTSRSSRKDSVLSPPTPRSRRPSASSISSHNSFARRTMRQSTFNSDSGISVSSSPDAHNSVTSKHVQRAQSATSCSDSTSSEGESSDEGEDEDGEQDNDESLSMSEHGPFTDSPTYTDLKFQPSRLALPDTDPLVQKLQEQEEALKNHILHSPQPKRAIKPPVSSSHLPSPTLPLYDRHATSAVPFPHPLSPPPSGLSHYSHGYAPSSYYDEQNHHQMHISQPQLRLDMERKTIAGYEMLAAKLSETTADEQTAPAVQPLYRKFEQLNHRILLHLQDEIAELEEELRVLDEMIAQSFVSLHDHSVQPASRRAEAKYGSELHFQRTQILGKVFLKMQQYNQALASYGSTKSKCAPAAEEDISSYKSWLSKHVPLDAAETRFLEFAGDLIRPGHAATKAANNNIELKQLLTAHTFMVIVPLLIFSMIPGLLAKVVLGVVICCIAAMVVVGVGSASQASERDVKALEQ